MAVRTAEALWEGNLKKGKGSVKLGSGVFEGKYSFGSRFEKAPGTNPEELIGAAHAGCFSMALSMILELAGYTAESIHTTARVSLDKVGEGFKITSIVLDTEGRVPGIDEKTFIEKPRWQKRDAPYLLLLPAWRSSLRPNF